MAPAATEVGPSQLITPARWIPEAVVTADRRSPRIGRRRVIFGNQSGKVDGNVGEIRIISFPALAERACAVTPRHQWRIFPASMPDTDAVTRASTFGRRWHRLRPVRSAGPPRRPRLPSRP
jgi:hypothetical protein